MTMAIAALVSLIGGIILGLNDENGYIVKICAASSDYFLYIMMFFAGVSVGTNRTVFSKIKSHNIRILAIPLTITASSVLSGLLCAPLTGLSYNESMAVTSCMGWYSIGGIMISEIAGAELGATAFLSSLMRETLSFSFIPLAAKYLNAYTTIAPGGATSTDTTLPPILKYAGAEMGVIGVISGVLCTLFVPFLINFFL